MYRNRSFALSLAYVQLAFSALLAVSIIVGYVEFRATVGQFSQSLAATIVSTANVIGQTAETIQTKQSLFDNALATLASSRKAIEGLRGATQKLTNQVPKIEKEFRSVSAVISKAGVDLSLFGDNLIAFSAPTSIHMEGIKPVITRSNPFESIGMSFKAQGTRHQS